MCIPRSQWESRIKAEAFRIGFDDCGIAKVHFLEDEAKRLELWLKKGAHGDMHYMEKHFDKRLNPKLLMSEAKSLIMLSYNYFPPKDLSKTSGAKIARYAYGNDYHFVVKAKLHMLLSRLRGLIGDFHARVFVDSAPIMERIWAKRAGIGWTGKHTLLINKRKGSYFFIAEILCDLILEGDPPATDHCGTCTRCIDACPTQAIKPQGYLNAKQCISYWTIEMKDKSKFKNTHQWLFGCDICQEVCPWNRHATPHQDPNLRPNLNILGKTTQDWLNLGNNQFKQLCKTSPLKRATHKGIRQTAQWLKKQNK